MKVTFIGLGAMGFPMAGHLAKSGYKVTVYNRTDSTAKRWLSDYHGNAQSTPALAAASANIVFMCVGNDDDVRSVVYGDNGVLASMQDNAILVDHTTTSAHLSKELSQACAKHNIAFMDAPVSGGQAGAENGKLTIMLGGNESHYKTVAPVLDSYSQKHQLMGNVGSGQLTKMVNQICISSIIQGLAEALHFAQKANLDIPKVIDVIGKGAAQSWQMDNRWSSMIDNKFDFGFAVDWMRKDLEIVLNEAKSNKSSLPVTALIDQFYAQVQANNGNRLDTSSLITLLK